MTEKTVTYAIHPAIGVARMGNAPLDLDNHATWYLGPEAPFETANQNGTYKLGGKIKKQAQRFRIYAYENGRAKREVTLEADDIEAITWTVHLANRKAALDPDAKGSPVSVPGVAPSSCWPAQARNANVPFADRDKLAIDPGPVTINCAGSSAEVAGTVSFPVSAGQCSAGVTLGTLYSEPGTGRLLVFAHDGFSAGVEHGSFSEDASLKTYANNDNWYDETADGSVTATIRFASGETVTLDQPQQAAWVICGVPKYAPGMGYFTSLYDVAIDVTADHATRSAKPSFMRDIFPMLRSISRLQWVNARGAKGHSPCKADFLTAGKMPLMAESDSDPSSSAYARRKSVFNRLRDPVHARSEIDRTSMPALPEEILADPNGEEEGPWDIPVLTPLQYARMENWSDGNFENDYVEGDPFTALDDLPVEEQPAALDRAALEGTAGTPFYPGIESWRIMRDADIYHAPLRLRAEMKPGDLSMGNALPWQADYFDCNDTWWPVQRPTQVLRAKPGSGDFDGAYLPASWTPATWKDDEGYTEMVKHWTQLGFIVSTDGGLSFHESERDDAGLTS